MEKIEKIHHQRIRFFDGVCSQAADTGVYGDRLFMRKFCEVWGRAGCGRRGPYLGLSARLEANSIKRFFTVPELSIAGSSLESSLDGSLRKILVDDFFEQAFF